MIEGNYTEKKQRQIIKTQNLTDYNTGKIKDILDHHDRESILTDQSVDISFDSWHSILTSTINDIAPEKDFESQKKQKGAMDYSWAN